MLETIENGKEFLFKDLVAYEEGKAVKKSVLQAAGATQIVVVALDHANLPEHTAPENAILTVLEGEGTINYEGTDHKLKHGDSFKMAKGAPHSLTCDKKMKFMLLFY